MEGARIMVSRGEVDTGGVTGRGVVLTRFISWATKYA
jgi:hypothetical protein